MSGNPDNADIYSSSTSLFPHALLILHVPFVACYKTLDSFAIQVYLKQILAFATSVNSVSIFWGDQKILTGFYKSAIKENIFGNIHK